MRTSTATFKQADLVLLKVVLASRVGLGLAIDAVVLVPATAIVTGGALIFQVLQAPASTADSVLTTDNQ